MTTFKMYQTRKQRLNHSVVKHWPDKLEIARSNPTEGDVSLSWTFFIT